LLVKEFPDERLQFEYSTVQEIQGVEFLVKQALPKQVHCLIPLDIPDKLKQLLEEVGTINVDAKQHLLVTFTPGPYSFDSPQTQLVLSNDWDQFLGRVMMPMWSDDTCLVIYIPLLIEELVEHAESMCIKRNLIIDLINAFGSALEYSSPTSVSFLANADGFIFLLHVHVPDSYPKEKPTVTVQSISQFRIGPKPLMIQYGPPIKTRCEYTTMYHFIRRDYPYSPRWSTQELAARLKEFFAENARDIRMKFDFDDYGK